MHVNFGWLFSLRERSTHYSALLSDCAVNHVKQRQAWHASDFFSVGGAICLRCRNSAVSAMPDMYVNSSYPAIRKVGRVHRASSARTRRICSPVAPQDPREICPRLASPRLAEPCLRRQRSCTHVSEQKTAAQRFALCASAVNARETRLLSSMECGEGNLDPSYFRNFPPLRTRTECPVSHWATVRMLNCCSANVRSRGASPGGKLSPAAARGRVCSSCL